MWLFRLCGQAAGRSLVLDRLGKAPRIGADLVMARSPAKKQAKAGAKKVAGKGKQAKRKSPSPPPVSEQGATGSAASSSGATPKARRVHRRDTDAQVERVIATRLVPDYPIEAVNGVVNKRGEHVRKYIANHIRENRCSQRYLTLRFWTQFSEFDLKAKTIGSMPDPLAQGEDIAEPLVKALNIAHSENPSRRSVEPIERYLEVMAAPNYSEFYGLVHVAQEAPTMSRQASVRMRAAILGCIVR